MVHVPMEVGPMKGKKGDRGKKGYGKGKFGKKFGKVTTKSNEHSKRNDYSKGSEKGKERGNKGKGKKTRTRNQLQIPVYKATAEHVENGDLRRVSVGKDMCKL